MGKILAYGEITITNLTEPFHVLLTNEAQQFVTNSSRVVTSTQSYYTDIIVYQGGTERTDYTIGTVSSANNITVSKTTSRVTFSVSANTTISADSGTFTIPITLDGETVNKVFSWSCAKQGATGATGSSAKAIDVTASSQVFKSTDGGATFSPDTITLTPIFQGGINYSKWQYSTNGGSSWTDVSNGSHSCTIVSGVLTVNKSCDLFTDTITTVSFKCISNNASYYDIVTVLKLYDVTGLQIGGRNLIRNSNFAKGLNNPAANVPQTSGWSNPTANTSISSEITFNGHNTLYRYRTGTTATSWTENSYYYCLSDSEIGRDITYTLSYWVYTDDPDWLEVSSNYIGASIRGFTSDKSQVIDIALKSPKSSAANVWEQRVNTFTIPGDLNISYFYFFDSPSRDFDYYLADYKLEYGNKATDWTPAPEDLESQIIENKNAINNVSLLVDNQQKEINAKVSTTTFQESIELLQNDIEEASQGLGKWLIEIYPKSLFDKSYQSRYDLPVFMSKANIVPSKSLLVADTELSSSSNYSDSYIGYGLTFVECSVAFSLTVPLYYNDSFTLYLNNQQVRSATSTSNSASTNVSVTFAFRAGWNCLEIVWNDTNGIDGFHFGTPISKNANITSMNCYYASITGRESQIVDNYAKLNVSLESIQAKVSSTETLVSEHDEKIQSLNERFTEIELTDEKIEMTVSNKISELVVGTRNLIRNSTNLIYADYSFDSNTQLTSENRTVLTDEDNNILLV